MSAIFISYSHNDREIVRRIQTFLEADGHTVWLDQLRMVSGDLIDESAVQAIQACSHFVLAHSSNSAQSDWVSFELSSAMRQIQDGSLLRVVPVRLDDTPLRETLRSTVHADFTGDIASGLGELKAGISSIRLREIHATPRYISTRAVRGPEVLPGPLQYVHVGAMESQVDLFAIVAGDGELGVASALAASASEALGASLSARASAFMTGDGSPERLLRDALALMNIAVMRDKLRNLERNQEFLAFGVRAIVVLRVADLIFTARAGRCGGVIIDGGIQGDGVLVQKIESSFNYQTNVSSNVYIDADEIGLYMAAPLGSLRYREISEREGGFDFRSVGGLFEVMKRSVSADARLLLTSFPLPRGDSDEMMTLVKRLAKGSSPRSEVRTVLEVEGEHIGDTLAVVVDPTRSGAESAR